MIGKDTYFLTEAVRLITKGPIVGEDDPVVKDLKEFYQERGIHVEPSSDIIPFLEQYGIGLRYADYAHPKAGNFNPELYSKWIEARRQLCQRRGWLARDIIKYGGDTQTLFGKQLTFPHHLMELIWELTDSPSGTLLDKIVIDKNKSGIIYPKIQIPFISWLNKNELNRISARSIELSPQKKNPAIKPLWDFNDLTRQIIEGWYIRNSLEIPKIEYPGIKLSKMDRCYELFKEAMEAGPQTPEQLQEWERRFSEFHSNYITRCAKRYGSIKQGPGAGNGLEWRKNPKFRKARAKKPAQ